MTNQEDASALIKAIKDRIHAGHDVEQIKAETLAAGHSHEVFAVALEAATAAEKPQLPGADQLIGEPFRFTVRNWRFLLLLSAIAMPPAILIAIMELPQFSQGTILAIVVGVLSLLTLIVGVCMLPQVVTQKQQEINPREALAWLKDNFLSLLWIQVLVGLIIFGGYLLFIIPGVILAVALQFSVFALVTEKLSGERALLYSRQLVKGHWWGVFWRFFLIGIITSLFTTPVTELIGFLAEAIHAPAGYAVSLVCFVFVHVSVSLFTMRASYQIYTSLQAMSVNDATAHLGVQRGLAVLGLVALLVLTTGFSYLLYKAQDPQWREAVVDAVLEEAFISEATAEDNLPLLSLYAANYQLTTGTYSGVCDGLSEKVDIVISECNDSTEAWALKLDYNETPYCIDSTGYHKQLIPALEERIQCLPL